MSDMTEEAVARAIELANENNMQVVSFKSAKWHREAQAAIATLQSLGWVSPEAAKAMRNEVIDRVARNVEYGQLEFAHYHAPSAIRAMKET